MNFAIINSAILLCLYLLNQVNANEPIPVLVLASKVLVASLEDLGILTSRLKMDSSPSISSNYPVRRANMLATGVIRNPGPKDSRITGRVQMPNNTLGYDETEGKLGFTPYTHNKDGAQSQKTALRQRGFRIRMNEVAETSKKPALREPAEPDDLSPYTMNDQMKEMTKDMSEANVNIQVLGKTMEHNELILLEMSDSKSDRVFRADESKYRAQVSYKKKIFIVHGLSTEGIKYLDVLKSKTGLKKILKIYATQLQKFDIALIPMANPDGFAYMKNGNEYGNKNMSPQTYCAGVALDRNFDVARNISVKNPNSCSQDFPGDAAFSEIESRLIKQYMHRYRHRIVAYLNVHAGTYTPHIYKGEAILYPKGHTDEGRVEEKYSDLKTEIDESMTAFKSMPVTVDSLYKWYGPVGGTSVDYASEVVGIPFALELVMQLYPDASMRDTALEEVWAKMIDVIFRSIFKTAQAEII